MTTTDVKDIVGTFVVKLSVMNIENNFFNTKLSLNENDNNFDVKLNDVNYKRIVIQLRDSVWKNSF